MLSVARHASVADIPDWDAVHGPRGLYLAAWWVRDTERMFADEARPTYLTVRDGARLIAATVCWTITRPQVVLPPLESSRLFARWSAEGDKLTKTSVAPSAGTELYPYTICGQPRGYVNGLHARAELEPAVRHDALVRLLEAAEEVARAAGSRLLLVPFLELDDAATAHAAAPAFEPTYGMTDCYLAPVSSIEAYLASFRSHRRRTIAQEIKYFAREGLHLEVRRLSDVLDLATELFIGAEKYGRDADRVYAAKEIADAAEHFDDKTRMYCAVQDGAIVAMAYFVRHEGVCYGRRFAHVPEASKRAALYPNLAYYAPIREAAGDGVHEIHYSGGSIEAKYLRGCKLRPRWNLVLPLADWDEPTRATMRACGRSLLDAERAQLGDCAPAEQIDEEIGLSRAIDLGLTR